MLRELVSRETIVTAALVYLAIGALLWFCLYCAGLIHDALKTRSALAVVLASIAVVCGWPIFVTRWVLAIIGLVRA